jgi:hypothetical protein
MTYVVSPLGREQSERLANQGFEESHSNQGKPIRQVDPTFITLQESR